jgi:hypothetical protein
MERADYAPARRHDGVSCLPYPEYFLPPDYTTSNLPDLARRLASTS